MTDDNAASSDEPAQPRWQPIKAIDRRVLGVLVEKAKTTPDAYPLSLNGLVTGCNQKNNRHPLTQYESDEIEESIDRLRKLGAVAAVQGGGRVEKYRHYMYEWLGVDKVELAVMAELLLRGAQTEGDLRGRVSRMDPIADLTVMRSLLDSLKEKGLVQALTPAGRGQVLSHTLYLPEELEKLKRQFGDHGGGDDTALASSPATTRPAPPAGAHAPSSHAPAGHNEPARAPAASDGELAALRREVAELRTALAQLRSDLADVSSRSQANAAEIVDLRRSLGG